MKQVELPHAHTSIVIAFALVTALVPSLTRAAPTGDTLPPVVRQLNQLSPACEAFFDLQSDSMFWNNTYLTPELCGDEMYLFSKYEHGACGTGEQGSTWNVGITGLYPDFAERLYRLMVAAADNPTTANMLIQYGYVKTGYNADLSLPGCTFGPVQPPESHGCAVVLNIPAGVCGPECKWLQQHAPAYGLQAPTGANFHNVLMPSNMDVCMSAVSNSNIITQNLPPPAGTPAQTQTQPTKLAPQSQGCFLGFLFGCGSSGGGSSSGGGGWFSGGGASSPATGGGSNNMMNSMMQMMMMQMMMTSLTSSIQNLHTNSQTQSSSQTTTQPQNTSTNTSNNGNTNATSSNSNIQDLLNALASSTATQENASSSASSSDSTGSLVPQNAITVIAATSVPATASSSTTTVSLIVSDQPLMATGSTAVSVSQLDTSNASTSQGFFSGVSGALSSFLTYLGSLVNGGH